LINIASEVMNLPFYIRILLLPFGLIYKWILAIRNLVFDNGWLLSTSFKLPIISVGNLSVGGTGKTPHIEYLISLLSNEYHLATLSRGYGRATKGFLIANEFTKVEDISDEPMQFYQKFKNIKVAVHENRVEGVQQILTNEKITQIILLDDAFQHRKIKPGLQILLTAFDDLYIHDWVLPAGKLRESISGAQRANIIIVTKCPSDLTIQMAQIITKKLKLNPNQKIFFSAFTYGNCYDLWTRKGVDLEADKIIVYTAIANNKALLAHVFSNAKARIEVVAFKDHYFFAPKDIESLLMKYKQMVGEKVLILTTEKDATRLLMYKKEFSEAQIQIVVQPIQAQILLNQSLLFNQSIFSYIQSFDLKK
jgi:tetraacyldisaccharide 4'-kinase